MGGWSGDTKQIVTKITGQRHTEDNKFPAHVQEFLDTLKDKRLSQLAAADKARFKDLMTESIIWQKFDHQRQTYDEKTPMNSYDVLKCSQACFHLFEWLRSLLPENERPARYVQVDITAFREKEVELKKKGVWPQDPPPGPQE